MSESLSKHTAAFDYFEKNLIVLSASAIRPPVGIASASFCLAFSLTAGIIKRPLEVTRNKKKKQ